MKSLHVIQKSDKLYVAGYNGLVGAAISRKLNKEGFFNIITRGHMELDLTNQTEVKGGAPEKIW